MDLPPWWYVLLIGTTLVASPFILRGPPRAAGRTFAAAVLVGLVLYELGLVLLYYSKLACWILVGAGVATIASRATPRRPWSGAIALAIPGAIAGAAFQSLPEPQAFLFYFSFAIPLLLLSALVPLMTGPIRWGAGPAQTAFGAALLSFAALTPASGFGFTFLSHYEIFHLPILLVVLIALGWYVRHGAPAAAVAADRSLRGRTPGDRAADARVRLVTGGIFVGLAVVTTAVALVAIPSADVGPFAWSLLALAAAGAGAGLAVPGRSGPVLTALGALSSIVAALAGLREGAEALQAGGGGPAPATIAFYVAGLGVASAALGAALAGAALREASAIGRRTHEVPSGFVAEPLDAVPRVADLEAFHARLRRAGAAGGVLFAEAAIDPLRGLDDAVEAWLAAQRGAPRVHVAVREGLETFFVPSMEAPEGP